VIKPLKKPAEVKKGKEKRSFDDEDLWTRAGEEPGAGTAGADSVTTPAAAPAAPKAKKTR
jgi:hypothetical protein